MKKRSGEKREEKKNARRTKGKRARKLLLLCFGNPLLPEDAAALQLRNVPGCRIKRCNSPEQILQHAGEFIIVDVVQGLRTARLLKARDVTHRCKAVTLHDFDLGFFLKLLEKLEPQRDINLIGLPQGIAPRKAEKEIAAILKTIKARRRPHATTRPKKKPQENGLIAYASKNNLTQG